MICIASILLVTNATECLHYNNLIPMRIVADDGQK